MTMARPANEKRKVQEVVTSMRVVFVWALELSVGLLELLN
jgi:hypothetical protein